MTTKTTPSAFDMTRSYWGTLGKGVHSFDGEMSEYLLGEHKVFWTNFIDKATELMAIKLGSVSDSGTPIITELVLNSVFTGMSTNLEQFKYSLTDGAANTQEA